MRLLKELAIKTLSRRMLVKPGKRFIFLYHDISDPGAFQHSQLYSTRPGVFREQIDFITRNFELAALDEILAPKSNAGRKCYAAITFDDGFHSVKEVALPYLSAKGIPAAVFINRMAVVDNKLLNDSENAKLENPGNEKVFLDESDVQSLSRAGVIIGSHTATHRKLVDCDDQMLASEIEGNKDYLERITGQTVRYLALPFGKREHYNEHVLDHCRRAGHEFVFSTNPTFFDSSSACYQRGLIPRIGLTNQSLAEIKFMINRPLFKTIDI